jgi:hypothetical protein
LEKENKKTICIIGSGTYGSYIANILSKYPSKFNLIVLEVGNDIILNENEIGYSSSESNINHTYAALNKGRYFGFGGSSSKWGGQLLFFDEYDFRNPNFFLRDLIDINKKYKSKVLERFGILNSTISKNTNVRVNENFTAKNGIWLSYFKRNLFKLFRINKKYNIEIISNARVTNIEIKDKKIEKVNYLKNNKKNSISCDFYFLTSGAFETSRILIDSSIINTNTINFSDHYSTKLFEIQGTAKFKNFDFTFNFNKDYSLSTNRLIGEIDNLSYFIHPIFNQNFLFFQNLKKFLFKGEFNFNYIFLLFKDFPYVIKFIFNLLYKRKLYIHKNTWFLQIDIESHTDISNMILSNDFDNFGIRTFHLNSSQNNNLTNSILKIKNLLKEFLIENNINYKELNSDPTYLKLEDTYHPYNIQSENSTVEEYYNKYDNLLIVNTGILPRVGGINPTATLFPLIEDFLNKKFRI